MVYDFTDPVAIIVAAIYLVPAIAISLPLHEWIHARIAVARGDLMPRLDGRLSLSPARHLDPFGTVVALFTDFGWGQPVAMNPARLRSRQDLALVAMAGPLMNALLMVALSFPLRMAYSAGIGRYAANTFLQSPADIAIRFIFVAWFFNAVLFVLNLIPLPPLDGYTFAGALLRRRIPKVFAWIDSRSGAIAGILLVLLFLPTYPPYIYHSPRQVVFTFIYAITNHFLLGT